ncbi:hypothetical protein [Bacillus multifaciens]|uniref:hypothetical protein n=1 Tax=Bacillus multifaciens TaxID=3068506 RepID=UPI0027412E13|nr:hypothetical protein [Bacillus sp. WLY-B-L8]MDP7977673.1 hypothetical protein [Bacillus sp. WLY-B-L8]
MNRNQLKLLNLPISFKKTLADNEYEISEEGDLLVTKNGKQNKVCNFLPILTHIVCKESNDSYEGYKYIFEGVIKGEERLPRIEILTKNLNNKKWIENWNPFCKIYSKKQENFELILDLVYLLSKQANKSIEFDSIGWNVYNNKWVYLYSNGSYPSTLENKLQTQTSVQGFDLLANPNLSEEEAFKHTLEMLDLCDHKLTYSLLCFLLTSLLTTPLTQTKDLSTNFSLWIYGRSGTGKTSIAELFSKVFDKTNMLRVDAFKNTIKKASLAYKDCVLILDDFGTSKNKNDESNTMAKVESIIRALSDKSNSLDSEVVPKGMVLFTGEKFIDMNEKNHSTAARLIRVKMDNIFNSTENNFEKERVEKFTKYKNGLYLQTSIKNYLRWLAAKLNNNLLDDYHYDFVKLRRELDVTVHARVVDSITHMIIAFNFYMTYGKEMGFITPEQYIEHCNKAREILMTVLIEQKKVVLPPLVEQFIDVLKKLLIEEKIKVIDTMDPIYGAKLNNDRNIYGILDTNKNSLKLQWASVLQFMDDYLRRQENFVPLFNHQSKTLGKLLSSLGYIRVQTYQNTNNVTKPYQIISDNKEGKGRVIDFYADKIPEITDIVQQLNPKLDLDASAYDTEVYDRQNYKRGKRKKGLTFILNGEEINFKR